MATIRTSRITPEFRWNPNASGGGRYIAPNGRFVRPTQVREAIDTYLQRNATEIETLARRLQNGEISVAAWQRGMQRAIVNTHMASGAASAGGWAQMTPSDKGHVGQLIKQELYGLKRWAEQSASGKRGGLQQFALDIENGLPLDGRFLQRARMYAQAARHTYEESRRRMMIEEGMTQAKSIRHAQDSCSGCIEQAALGWQPIEELVQIGERDCLRNCKCTVEYREGQGTEEFKTLVYKAARGTLSASELRRLSDGIADAGFDTRAYQRVRKKDGLGGVEWQGRELKLGDRIPTADLHYLKHVVQQQEWPQGTTQEQYEQEIRKVIKDPKTGIMYSEYHGEPQITFVRPTTGKPNEGDREWTLVDYRVGTQSWMTGFRPDEKLSQVLKNHRNRVWLRGLK